MGFLIATRDINPYLNKGHQAILNNILFAELTTVVFGLIIKAEFLSPTAATSMSVVTLAVALLAWPWPHTPPTSCFHLNLSTFWGTSWVGLGGVSVTKALDEAAQVVLKSGRVSGPGSRYLHSHTTPTATRPSTVWCRPSRSEVRS